jgi:putative transposase
MARKRYSEEYTLRLLREIEVHLSGGMGVITACRAAGISHKTYNA